MKDHECENQTLRAAGLEFKIRALKVRKIKKGNRIASRIKLIHVSFFMSLMGVISAIMRQTDAK